MPTRLMEVTIPCRRYAETKFFYSRILSMPIAKEGQHHAFLDTGGSLRIALVDANQSNNLTRPTGRGAYFNLSCDDLVSIKRKLVAANIAVEDERSDEFGRNITVKDPEGNIVNLYQEGTF